MIEVLFQLLVLGNFVSVEELEGAARTLHEEFHRLTETEVTQKIKDISPLSAQISASKFQNLSQIPLKICGVWKIVVFDLKLTQNLKTHSKFPIFQ